MENNNIGRELVGLLFPGIVKNDDKAITCLGGIRNISSAYSSAGRKRLGLSFQPENPFVRKIFGASKRAAGVLMKVKVKKVKEGDVIRREVISTSVVGCVKTMFRFESMCDFQYLPVHRESSDGPMTCDLEKYLPCGTDTIDFMLQPAPLFLIPSSFTRFERPIGYAYTDKRYPERASPDRERESVHNKIRTLRGTQVTPYIFNLIDDLPSEPHEVYLKLREQRLECQPNLNEEFDIVKKLFDDRPIMSVNLIRYRTKLRLVSLKVIMPCLAVYMKTGPWRSMWVRYGYDPRKDPEARKYQTLDFRLRHAAGVRSMIMSREDTADRERQPKRRFTESSPANEDIAEATVYFRPGLTPTQRHIFYQYCDIQIPEVEEILAAEPPPGYMCHLKRGWLPANTDEICRDHMFRYVKDTLFNSSTTELKFEAPSGSESESNSEDDTTVNDVDDIDDSSK